MRIVTFGSCLSRYMADMWLTMMEGQLVNSVYHNRIDALMANFFSGEPRGIWLPDYNELMGTIRQKKDAGSAVKEVILNQYPRRVGMHNLPKWSPTLMKTLYHSQVDLILMDNYVDIGVRLLSPKTMPEKRFFGNFQFFEEWEKDFILGELIETEAAVRHWQQLMLELRRLQPQARLVFTHFPVNCYGSQDRERRSVAFEQAFRLPAGLEQAFIIPPIAVAAKHQTDEPRHFQPTQYAFYTGLLYKILADNHAHPKPLRRFQGIRRRMNRLASAVLPSGVK